MAKRTSSAQLREQMAELQRLISQAEETEREDRLQSIVSAVRRSGLLDYDLDPEEVVAALRTLAPMETLVEKPGRGRPRKNKTVPVAPTPAEPTDPETPKP